GSDAPDLCGRCYCRTLALCLVGLAMKLSPVDGQIRLENLTVSYDREPAVHHLTGCFEAGSLTAVVGPNGAGKSTLLKSIAGILKPDEGSIMLEGFTARQLGYLPQQADIDR